MKKYLGVTAAAVFMLGLYGCDNTDTFNVADGADQVEITGTSSIIPWLGPDLECTSGCQ